MSDGKVIDARARFVSHPRATTAEVETTVVDLAARRMDFAAIADVRQAGEEQYRAAVKELREGARRYPELFRMQRFELACILAWGSNTELSMSEAIEAQVRRYTGSQP